MSSKTSAFLAPSVRAAGRRLPARSLLAVACALAAAGAAQAQTALSQLMVQGRGAAQLAPADETQLSGVVRVIVHFAEPSVVESRAARASG